jgi:hypothetical protein
MDVFLVSVNNEADDVAEMKKKLRGVSGDGGSTVSFSTGGVISGSHHHHNNHGEDMNTWANSQEHLGSQELDPSTLNS